MIVKQRRLSQQVNDQLSRLKGKTTIQHWNVLGRGAFCLSLSESTDPPDIDLGPNSSVEISWQVFGEEYQELYSALLRERCMESQMPLNSKTSQRQFRLHLHRGLAYLAIYSALKNGNVLLDEEDQGAQTWSVPVSDL